MDGRVGAVCAEVVGRLRRAGVPCALGGSGLLWAWGLSAQVGDLDLMVPASHETATLAALDATDVAVDRAGTDLWATAWFATVTLDSVAVDLLGGLALRHPGGVAVLPADPVGSVQVAGVDVPLADPAGWWVLYRAYKPAKATLLETIVPRQRRRALLDELGLPPSW